METFDLLRSWDFVTMLDSGSNTGSDGSTDTNEYHTFPGAPYSLPQETDKARDVLLSQITCQISPVVADRVRAVEFRNGDLSLPPFPCPFKQTEAIGALKSLEAGLAVAIADSIYGRDGEREAEVDLRLASCFLFSTYLATIGGYGKADPESKAFLKSIATTDAP